jgi:hypothetical protein
MVDRSSVEGLIEGFHNIATLTQTLAEAAPEDVQEAHWVLAHGGG